MLQKTSSVPFACGRAGWHPGSQRFVEKQHVGLHRNGARHGNTLPLAARKLVDRTIGHVVQAQQVQQSLHPGLDAPLSGCPGVLGPIDILTDVHMWEEGIVLEHHAGAARVAAEELRAPTVRRSRSCRWDGSSKPPIILSVVVLPQPEGPSKATNSPFRTDREKSSTATVLLPKTLETWSSTTSG